jgi:hypothetical protein
VMEGQVEFATVSKVESISQKKDWI